MPDTQFMTKAAATLKGTTIKTLLATSKLRMCQAPFVPNEFTTIDDLEANEADFDGYPAGGYSLTAWTGPLNPLDGGAVITSPLANVIFATPSTPPVGNELSAWWVETAAGDVFLVGIYNPVRVLAGLGDGFPFVIQDVEGRNGLSV